MSDPQLAIWLYLMVLLILFLFGKTWQALWTTIARAATAKAGTVPTFTTGTAATGGTATGGTTTSGGAGNRVQ